MIPSSDVDGTVKFSPSHIAGTWLNEGVLGGLIVIVIVAVVAHCPAAGVKVYVVVCVLSMAGDQVPVIPSFDVVDKAGITSPEQKGPTCAKVGVEG